MSQGNEISRRYQGPRNDNPLVPTWMQDESPNVGGASAPRPKPHRLLAPDYPYPLEDITRAAAEWGLNCGPAALCTMLSLKPDDVRYSIPQFEHRKYTNPTMMKLALTSLGVQFHEATPQEVWKVIAERPQPITLQKYETFPIYGLARIQFEGRWMNPGVPIQARYRHTHWVGSMAHPTIHRELVPSQTTGKSSLFTLYIFDVNSGWTDYAAWRDQTMPGLTSDTKGATGGWHCTHRLQLDLRLLDQH